MKVSVRRHGIVIRSVDVRKSPARIGSSEANEIRIDDPYLAPHVGDLVEKNKEWRIVDAAESLEGITRNGQRIDDEPIAWNEPYSIGGFELVAESDEISRASAPTIAGNVTRSGQPSTAGGNVARPGAAFPATVVEDISSMRGGAFPATVVQDLGAIRRDAGMPGSPAPVQPMQQFSSAPVASPAAALPPPKSKKLLLVVGGLAFVLILLLLGVVVMSQHGAPAPVTSTTTTVAASTTTQASRPAQAPDTDQTLAARLEVDTLLDRWEKQLATAPDADVQRRFAQTAVDLGLAHAAAHDDAGARKYFERAARIGDPASEAVRIAKGRLAS
jgi:hypothetical protein